MGQNLCGLGKAMKNTGNVKMARSGDENVDEITTNIKVIGNNKTLS